MANLSSKFASVRGDPRYWALIEKLQLPPLPPDHPGYAEEQVWKINKLDEKLIAKRGLVPAGQN